MCSSLSPCRNRSRERKGDMPKPIGISPSSTYFNIIINDISRSQDRTRSQYQA